MSVERESLRKKIEQDPDLDCEAGRLHPEALATRPEREAQEAVAWGERYGSGRLLTLSLKPSAFHKVPLYEAPPDAAATIERLQEQVRNLTVLLDQQFGTPCAQVAYAAELASLREKVKAAVAAEREACAQAAEDACATPPSDFAGVELEAFHRGADAMNDTVVAAIRARAALTTEEG